MRSEWGRVKQRGFKSEYGGGGKIVQNMFGKGWRGEGGDCTNLNWRRVERERGKMSKRGLRKKDGGLENGDQIWVTEKGREERPSLGQKGGKGYRRCVKVWAREGVWGGGGVSRSGPQNGMEGGERI